MKEMPMMKIDCSMLVQQGPRNICILSHQRMITKDIKY